jgi:hypothetical protein
VAANDDALDPSAGSTSRDMPQVTGYLAPRKMRLNLVCIPHLGKAKIPRVVDRYGRLVNCYHNYSSVSTDLSSRIAQNPVIQIKDSRRVKPNGGVAHSLGP